MSKPSKRIPEFRAEGLDWSKAHLARFPNLKPSTRVISLRLPLSLLERIKIEANKRDVPYQSLIKVWLAEKLDQASPAPVLSAAARRFIGSDKRAVNRKSSRAR